MDTMHIFAGAGGGLLADLILGHRPIVAVEWDAHCCAVLRERAAEGWFPGLHVWEGDVRLFDPSEYAGRVDCIHAGFPCQDISTAGKQAGVGEETRSGLYREVLRIAGVVRPRKLFLENVSAIVTNGIGTVLADLAALGYDAEWLCLRASDCGANHYRDRWWLLADSCGIRQQGSDMLDGTIAGENEPPSRRSLGGAIEKNDVTDSIGRIEELGWPLGRMGRKEQIQRNGDWEITSEPFIRRGDDGFSTRIHRLKALGNAQVPLQAATAFMILSGGYV